MSSRNLPVRARRVSGFSRGLGPAPCFRSCPWMNERRARGKSGDHPAALRLSSSSGPSSKVGDSNPSRITWQQLEKALSAGRRRTAISLARGTCFRIRAGAVRLLRQGVASPTARHPLRALEQGLVPVHGRPRKPAGSRRLPADGPGGPLYWRVPPRTQLPGLPPVRGIGLRGSVVPRALPEARLSYIRNRQGGRLLAVVCVAALAAAAPVQAASPEDELVSIRYLGSAGLAIRSGGDSILTAPFFSNPGLLRVLFLPIAPDPGRLPDDVEGITRDARAILVGHSHYDHLMDVPLVAERMPGGGIVYASETAAHILAGADLGGARVVAVNDAAGSPQRPGRWIQIPGTPMRFMAILSGHAPHFAGMRFYDGRYREDWKELPRFASQWKLGQPFTFVIDILDPAGSAPRFRIFYQDAATDPPEGFPPPLDDGKEYDLAVLCVASFSQVEDHPGAIVRHIRPRAVLLVHWESFFRSHSKPVRRVPGTNVRRFIRRLEEALPRGTPWWMPDPGESLRLPLAPAMTDSAETPGPEPPRE